MQAACATAAVPACRQAHQARQAAPVVVTFGRAPHSQQPANSTAARRLAAAARRRSGVMASAVAAPTEAPAMKVVEVDLGDRTYPIYIGRGLLDQGELLRKHIPGKTALIVTNETVAPLYLDRCLAAVTACGGVKAEVVVLPDGEQHKTLEVLQKVWDKALECRLDRNTTFIALGGGVVGDMTGFAAAAYQRGVHFIQVPTTVMSQVDSSVGGKTGVNHPLGKNMIGAFYQPRCVLIDTDSLNTLPDRELASGISEVIKYGLIRDAPLFEWLEANMDKLLQRDPEAFTYAIERSCVNKAEVVAADEKEGGVRATLNLGHTFGHAIETCTGYGAWLHGEAVGAGTMMAADMSHRLGWIDAELLQRIRALNEKARLPVEPPPNMTVEQFRNTMAVDKKVQDGKLRLILLKGPLGGCVITGDFEVQALEDTLAAFCSDTQ
ncbi:3-dehydroquinate synthase [Micractinium conductrix]|uniref:3-dehydroquinate synthase, chloroplastic n=1 Tax=Micractinium conductrix TaxID=554055 RepID=A0A2P6V947_9CHLO|nr:3-dehydroquinate synthase [Micractinium conductrix]|eukprot:PSC70608.1 3-dehydroquinate synthase [Micractinium conductrix]